MKIINTKKYKFRHWKVAKLKIISLFLGNFLYSLSKFEIKK